MISPGRSSRAEAVYSGRVRAVIFDLDGLLLDTESIFRRVDAEAVGRYGARVTDDLRQRTLGLTHEAKDQLFVEELGLAVAPDVLGDERTEMLIEFLARADLMPGATALVGKLATAAIPMAIATSSTIEMVRLKLERHPEIAAAMNAMATSDHRAVRHPKPAPDVFLAAAYDLNVDPADCLAFEDAPSGIESALAAGMKVIAVPDPGLPPHPILARAHQVLRSLLAFEPGQWGITVAQLDNVARQF